MVSTLLSVGNHHDVSKKHLQSLEQIMTGNFILALLCKKRAKIRIHVKKSKEFAARVDSSYISITVFVDEMNGL